MPGPRLQLPVPKMPPDEGALLLTAALAKYGLLGGVAAMVVPVTGGVTVGLEQPELVPVVDLELVVELDPLRSLVELLLELVDEPRSREDCWMTSRSKAAREARSTVLAELRLLQLPPAGESWLLRREYVRELYDSRFRPSGTSPLSAEARETSQRLFGLSHFQLFHFRGTSPWPRSRVHPTLSPGTRRDILVSIAE